MNLTLHELSTDLANLLEQVDPDTGELPPELGNLQTLVANKATAVAAYIANAEAVADALHEHAKRKADEAKRMRRRAERLRKYLGENMVLIGVRRITAADGTLSIEVQPWRDRSVEILNVDDIPDGFTRTRVVQEPDKTAIRQAWDEGLEVNGSRLVTSHRVTIK